jgi:hypothetical protein
MALLSVVLLACGGPTADAGAGAGAPDVAAAGSPAAPIGPGVSAPLPTDPLAPLPSGDPHAELCRRISDVETQLATMRAVELRVTNRVALDIELSQLQVVVGELQEAELGALEEELERPLTRLGYRLQEVELAVEDFRTNSRPQRAVPHVEEDTQTFADELAAFRILARC